MKKFVVLVPFFATLALSACGNEEDSVPNPPAYVNPVKQVDPVPSETPSATKGATETPAAKPANPPNTETPAATADTQTPPAPAPAADPAAEPVDFCAPFTACGGDLNGGWDLVGRCIDFKSFDAKDESMDFNAKDGTISGQTPSMTYVGPYTTNAGNLAFGKDLIIKMGDYELPRGKVDMPHPYCVSNDTLRIKTPSGPFEVYRRR